jgi:hypothetical protein
MKGTVQFLLDNDLYNGRGSQPTFIPGQPITGRVAYTATSRNNIDEVIIILKGRCQTVVRRPDLAGFGKDSYSEDIELFRSKKPLFTGPFTFQPTTTEWHFGFVLPKQTTYVRDIGEQNWLYQTQPHQLPPSTTSAGDGHKAVVSYYLKVIINPGSHLHSEEWNLQIAVTNCSDKLLPEPTVMECAFAESAQHRPRKPSAEKMSFKQKIGHVFSKDTFQHAAPPFLATAYMSGAASVSQSFPIAISIRRLPGTASPDKSTLTLQHVSLQLVAKVHARVKLRGEDFDEKIWEDLGQNQLVTTPTPVPAHGEAFEIAHSVRVADLIADVDKDRRHPSPQRRIHKLTRT